MSTCDLGEIYYFRNINRTLELINKAIQLKIIWNYFMWKKCT